MDTETVGRPLVECEVRLRCVHAQKNELCLKECWCIPPHSDRVVCAVGSLSAPVWGQAWSVWTRPARTGERTRRPRPARPGAAGSYDYEYERNGVTFLLFAPLEGWRRVEVTDRRTKADWARVVKQRCEDYPHKDRIVLVMDNLNTHHPASLYEAFEPAEARRMLEVQHGSWLDIRD